MSNKLLDKIQSYIDYMQDDDDPAVANERASLERKWADIYMKGANN